MITDELRAVAAKTECANGRCEKLYRGDLDHIADRIDAAHRAALEKLAAGADEDRDGWVELPKDADGEYVRIGDVMEIDGEVLPPVSGIGNGSVIVGVFGVDKDDDISEVFSLDLMRHHRPDTWERIIEDALGSRWSAPDKLSSEFIALVDRCKALCERTKEAGE